MIERLLQPLRTAATWRSLVHAVLDLPVGLATFVPIVILLALSGALLITLPLALPVIVVLFMTARLIGKIERGRVAALHRVQLADPIAPSASGSWWQRFKAMVTSGARWKEIAYALLRLPTGMLFTVVALHLWAGSMAVLLLPLYAGALPGDEAHFGLFDVSAGAEALLGVPVGLLGLLVVAPWATHLIGFLDVGMARILLGPAPGAELVRQAAKAERGRAAAVDAAETERRRIERDLHDGAQQRLVALAMDLGAARQRLDTDPDAGKALVAEAHEEAKAALKEIRDLVRGIHPVILEDRGLDAALSAVVARSPIPVDLRVALDRRLPDPVESAAYFVVSEALANVARHSSATRAHVAIAVSGDRLIVEIRDDGIGGADPRRGSGLVGLAGRATALGGTLDLLSPPGGPTTLLVELPCGS